MKIENKNYKSNKISSNVTILFFAYWFILVIFQNFIINYSSSVDTILKISLLMIFCLYFIIFHKEDFKYLPFYMLFLLIMSFSFSMEGKLQLRNLLTYFYPLLFILFTFFIGGKEDITKKQLINFCKLIICFVLFMCIFSFFKFSSKILNVFDISHAYGNELSSFFVSNHEYALYLMSAVICCIICIHYSNKINNFFYYLVILVFLFNLLLTFSRTFILGTCCFLFIYLLINFNNKSSKIILFAFVLLLIVIAFVPKLNSFVFEIVLKSNNLAGRDNLLKAAIEKFKSGSLLNKFFGYEVSEIINMFYTETLHTNAHNALVQILLYFGILGLSCYIIIIICRGIACIKAIKKDRFMGTICLALLVSCCVIMLFNTILIFDSETPSFFTTIFMIIIPKYVINSINNGRFLS